MEWIPIVTFLQVSADMAVAVDVPDGHGHVYVKDVANAWTANAIALAALHDLHVRYVFVGDTERNVYDKAALDRLHDGLRVVFTSGDTFVAEVP